MKRNGGKDGSKERKAPDHVNFWADRPVSSRTRSKVLQNQIELSVEEDIVTPFLMPPVLRCVLKHVQTQNLKVLRSISSLWNQMTLKEMEKRALNDEYHKFGFNWNQRRDRAGGIWNTQRFMKFFRATQTQPNLFRSAYFHFPNATLVLKKPGFTSFFEKYQPCFVNLALEDGRGKFRDDAKNLLREFAHWMAPTLRELTISNAGYVSYGSNWEGIPKQSSNWTLSFPNLKILILDHSGWRRNTYGIDTNSSPSTAFTTLFGQGNCEMPKLDSLTILFGDIGGHLDDLFGINVVDPIQWRSLTSLHIVAYRIDMMKFTTGLLFLTRSGMALNNLILTFNVERADFNNKHQTFGNLSQFLLNQADLLQHLGLNLKFNINNPKDEILPKINLPVFPSITSLDISGHYYCNNGDDHEHFELYNLISIPQTFPSLKHLSISSRGFTTMALLRKNVDPFERTHLDIFEYHDSFRFNRFIWDYNPEWTDDDNNDLLNNFSSVGLIKID